MDQIPAAIPFHVARAYGLGRSPATQIEGKPRIDASAGGANSAVKAKLVATLVNQPMRFDAVDTFEPSIRATPRTPVAQPASFPLYAHPADKNAAATAINAGRVIDTQA